MREACKRRRRRRRIAYVSPGAHIDAVEDTYSNCDHACRPKAARMTQIRPLLVNRANLNSDEADYSTRHNELSHLARKSNGVRRAVAIMTRNRACKTDTCFISKLPLISLATILITICLSNLVGSDYNSQSLAAGANSLTSKFSGQFHIAQLCAGKSQLPTTKRVEGAVLSSLGDADINCTVTFRTKSTQQHFIIRFEELRLGCTDHLKMFDGDLDYGQPSIKDFSCRDSLANVPVIKTTGTYLTLRYTTDSKSKPDDGFRMVITAAFDVPYYDCPADYTHCRHTYLCVSRSLYCDGVNHCIDNSDETGCASIAGGAGSSSGSILGTGGELSLSNALVMLCVLVLIIFVCVIVLILVVYCRRENQFAAASAYQLQHPHRGTIGLPIAGSSSIMFAPNSQPHYQYFQTASPFVTPQHHPHAAAAAAALATLPRGYSTVPLNAAAMPRQLIQMHPPPHKLPPKPPQFLHQQQLIHLTPTHQTQFIQQQQQQQLGPQNTAANVVANASTSRGSYSNSNNNNNNNNNNSSSTKEYLMMNDLSGTSTQ